MVVIIYSDEFLDHHTGPGHPERPDRLRAVRQELLAVSWAEQLQWQLPTPVAVRDPIPHLEIVHPCNYWQQVSQLAGQGGGMLDADTIVSPRSYEVALLAVNAWIDGVEEVLKHAAPTFVLARPPGHHAERDRGMGFCLFSNAAIAAHYALTQPQIQRVAILDWDVHHGNGTQAIVETNPQLAYCSLHQFPCYPGTGRATERGKYHNVLNVPMAPGSAIADYQTQFDQQVLPFLAQFQPDLLIVSAGYDANQDDPLANINLHPQDYGTFTTACLTLTHNILFGLEGGYHLEALADSVIATLAACLPAPQP